MLVIMLFILYVMLASSGLILFKLGSENTNITIKLFSLSLTFSLKMLIGLFCYGCSFILWMIIVSKMNLTIAMPLSVAIVNTLVIIGSCIILKEKITFTQGLGIFIIILGVCIMTYGSNK